MDISIGVFCYNEQDTIIQTLNNIFEQDLFQSEHKCKIYVLANGCRDNSIPLIREWEAKLSLEKQLQFELLELRFAGKSRTWNHFVHNVLSNESGAVIFADGDIAIPDSTVFSRLVGMIENSELLLASSSLPIKDIEHTGEKPKGLDKLIKMGAADFDTVRHSICGQLYIARASTVRDIYMPIGLPVEDGFLRAMIMTDLFTLERDLRRIDSQKSIWHVYESLRGMRSLVRHQIRIVIGTTINRLIFQRLDSLQDRDSRIEELRKSSEDENWLKDVINSSLPVFPYGYIHPKFILKRTKNSFENKKHKSLKGVASIVFGLAFDITVYIFANIKMSRGNSAGFW